MLKIRSTLTKDERIAQMKEWTTKNSQRYALSNTVQLPLPSLDHPDSDFSENREESQIAEPLLCTDGTTLENAPDAQNAQCTPYAPGTCKSTRENFGKPAKLLVTNFTKKRHY